MKTMMTDVFIKIAFMRNFISQPFSIFSIVGLLLVLGVLPTNGQVSITSFGIEYSEDFNSLASTGTSSTLPSGWFLAESGANANTTYAADDGGSNAGNTYSYGDDEVAERAFGTLRSSNLFPIVGGAYTNNTGATITSLAISYKGEQWRIGALGREDRLDFQYSLNATSLTTGTWVDFNALDFVAPNTVGPVGQLNGNAIGNSTLKSATIGSLALINGGTIWIRWTDFDPSGSDDGLAVDDFSIVACGNVICPSDFSVCSTGPQVELTGGIPAGGTYSGNGVTGNFFDPSTAAIGVNIITYTIDDMMGCFTTCTFNITVNETPTVTCPDNITVCTADPPFALEGENPSGGEYSGSGVENGIFDPSQADLGDNVITYDYFDPEGCDGFCTFIITVEEAATVTCPDDITVCNTTPAFALTGGSPAGGTYTGTGVTGDDFDPAMANLGDNLITYTYGSGDCSSSCTFTINVTTDIAVTCPVDITVCSGDAPFELTGGAPAGGTYTGTGVTGSTFDPSSANIGVNEITYSYTSGTCEGSCTFNITVNEGPNADAGLYGPLCETGPNIMLNGAPAGGVWSGIGITGGNMFDPSAGTQTLTYTVMSGGCTDSDQTTITVNPCLMAPEVRWVLLDEDDTNGSCASASDCSNNTVCVGMQYTPGFSGLLLGYTTGTLTECDNGLNPVVSNTTCLPMTNNSPTFLDCAGSGLVLFNSSANTPTQNINVTAGTPIVIHQVCFTIPNDGSLVLNEYGGLDVTMTIQPPSGPAVTDFPTYFSYNLDSVVACGLLPVRFLDFTAKKYGELQSQLDWMTADEINNAYFEIQRSNDGGATWTNIGEVDAVSSPRSINTYRFIDRNAKVGANLYRLKQFDRDGWYQYSPLRVVNFTTGLFSVKAYPNPTTDILTITVNNAEEEGTIHMLDMSGQVVLEQKFEKGITDNEAFVDRLPAGVYTLIVRTGKNEHLERIVVID